MIALSSEKALLLDDDELSPQSSTASLAIQSLSRALRSLCHTLRNFLPQSSTTSTPTLLSPASPSQTSQPRPPLPFLPSLTRRHILIFSQLLFLQALLLLTLFLPSSPFNHTTTGGLGSSSTNNPSSAHYKYNNSTLLFLPGATHILPLPTNATLRVQLTHQPLDPAAYVLALLKATNDVMAAPGDKGKNTGEVFDARRTSWYELPPWRTRGTGRLEAWKERGRKEAERIGKAGREKLGLREARGGGGVFIHLKMERYHGHRFDKVLVIGVLQALHQFRERPYMGKLQIKGNDGFEYGVGCLGDRNGTCA